MTLSELIEQLTALAEELNPSGDLFAECDPEVLIAHQPSWPLQFAIGEVVALDDPQVETKIFLGESWAGTRYLTAGAAAALGWK